LLDFVGPPTRTMHPHSHVYTMGPLGVCVVVRAYMLRIGSRSPLCGSVPCAILRRTHHWGGSPQFYKKKNVNVRPDAHTENRIDGHAFTGILYLLRPRLRVVVRGLLKVLTRARACHPFRPRTASTGGCVTAGTLSRTGTTAGGATSPPAACRAAPASPSTMAAATTPARGTGAARRTTTARGRPTATKARAFALLSCVSAD